MILFYRRGKGLKGNNNLFKDKQPLERSSVFAPESPGELVKHVGFTALKPIDSDSLGIDKESAYLTI